MKVIRFVDIIETLPSPEGGMYEKVKLSNFTLPTIIDPSNIETVCPLFSNEGKLFKNVSVIRYNNEMMKVLGSPEYIWDLKTNKREPFVGFYGKQREETPEERTKTESNTKRRTKTSS